jgi:[amino group carrier protein]-L-2-aminoadipate/L-glutamate 6-kinase
MTIIKIGGGEHINLEAIIKDLIHLDDEFIIVHGANALRDEIAKKLDYEKNVLISASGYSSVYSDKEALDIMMMSYSGLRNKRIVEMCQQNGINAIGLTGVDGKLIEGQRNKGIRVKENGKLKIVRDFSGKPKVTNMNLITLLLSNGYVPIITVPIIDENNFAISSENDDIVALFNSSLKADKIIQLIEAPGFLDDVNNPDSVVKNISKTELELRESQVEGRMKRKMKALTKLFESGKTSVYICDGRIENPITNALNGGGTIIQ